MFDRLIISSLKTWADSSPCKPLVLRGARQVGKTTLVKEFAKEFSVFIHLNLEKEEQRRIFSSGKNFPELLDAIFYLSGKERNKGKTLIFIDEIQNSPEAIGYLRYFYEEAPELFVIAAGSLLESMLNRNISFPVGRVDYMALRPCSFLEFIGALGEQVSAEMITSGAVPGFAHEKLKSLFHRYALIGGMPEIVAVYAATGDLIRLKKTYQSLLAGFSDDVEKYASNNAMIHYIRHIFKTGFSFAGQRIKFANFGVSDYRSREMGEAFRTLEKTMLLELIYPASSVSIPILSNYRKSPRLQWVDTGLVNYAAGVQHEIFTSPSIMTAWKGIIAEHITGQELLAYDNDVLSKRHFWTREEKNSMAEIDFIFNYNGIIIPVEVKSGDTGRLRSLHLFMDAASHKIAVRICQEKFAVIDLKTIKGKPFRLISIPFYQISQISQILDKYV